MFEERLHSRLHICVRGVFYVCWCVSLSACYYAHYTHCTRVEFESDQQKREEVKESNLLNQCFEHAAMQMVPTHSEMCEAGWDSVKLEP